MKIKINPKYEEIKSRTLKIVSFLVSYGGCGDRT